MKYLFSFLLLCLTLQGSAQDIRYSEYQDIDRRDPDYSVVGMVGGMLFTYRTNQGEHYLDIWDDSMTLQATVVLDFFPKKLYDAQFIAYPDKIIALFQGSDGGHVLQQAALLDARGRLQGRVLNIDQAKAGFFGSRNEYFSISVSENKRRLMVYDAVLKGASVNLRTTLLDDSLHILKRAESSYRGENNLSLMPAMLNNEGDFYLPIATALGSKDYADGIWLLKRPADGSKLVAKEIPLGRKFAAGLYLKADNLNRCIYAGGFYSQKKAGNFDGVLLAQYNMDSGSIVSARQLPFDEQIRLNATGRKSQRAFNDFLTRQLIIRNDGGFVLIAEDYYMSVRSGLSPYGYYSSFYYPFMTTQNIREYHYGDIMALCYDGLGHPLWHAFIRKDQYSQEDAGVFSSYAFINTGGSLGFLYNDFDNRSSHITLSTIEAGGKTNAQQLNMMATQPDWQPRAGKQVSGRDLVVPCLKGRRLCFAKIVF
ncbi:MAG: hypothetical protein JST06_06580 [Bacteroidetes bacterium]|nr:hypothetical protein [Bacteroidota bacterium]MBS1629872.1 hypothetical protein [Bacteroidota bacterium]